MKKIIIVFSGFLLLALGSCSKVEIRPNQHNDCEVRDFNSNTSENEKCGRDPMLFNSEPADTTITDPNRDEDEERKVKRKSKGN